MINKNKEEIEKIEREINQRVKDKENKSFSNTEQMNDLLLIIARANFKERIKTSIEWCEDEIEFLEEFNEFYKLSRQHVINVECKFCLRKLKQKRGQDEM